jgi:cobaltochelatase CobS
MQTQFSLSSTTGVHVGNFSSIAKALKAVELYTGSINRMEAEKRFEKNGYILTEITGENNSQSAKVEKPANNNGNDQLLDLIARSLEGKVKVGLDYNEITKIIDEKITEGLKTVKPREIEIKHFDKPTIKLTNQHYQFDTLLAYCAMRENSLLVGPAGSGKTTAAKNVSTALNLPFYYLAVSAQTTVSQIFGYLDANSNYTGTLFRKAYQGGGIFLLDEIDAGNSNTLTAINAAIENGVAAFPDGLIEKHPDFIVIAAANTFGTGADRQYVGRNQLDLATLDRFIPIEWNYDTTLELEISSNKAWTAYMQRIRDYVAAQKMRLIFSPRKSLRGGKALAYGLSIDVIKDTILFGGVPKEQRDLIEKNVPTPEKF